jgi:competence protein ComEC
MPGVLRRRRVAELEVGPLPEPAAQRREVAGWARDAGLEPVVAQVGERRTVGPLTWRVLWPQRIIRGPESAPNNASVVLLVEAGGLRLLLLGDVEPTAQRAVARSLDGPVDVLKVAHHGSAYQDGGLRERAHPKVALVSVGEGNDYGHPAAQTLAALQRLGTKVLRTDRDGDIAVVSVDGRASVVARAS